MRRSSPENDRVAARRVARLPHGRRPNAGSSVPLSWVSPPSSLVYAHDPTIMPQSTDAPRGPIGSRDGAGSTSIGAAPAAAPEGRARGSRRDGRSVRPAQASPRLSRTSGPPALLVVEAFRQGPSFATTTRPRARRPLVRSWATCQRPPSRSSARDDGCRGERRPRALVSASSRPRRRGAASGAGARCERRVRHAVLLAKQGGAAAPDR